MTTRTKSRKRRQQPTPAKKPQPQLPKRTPAAPAAPDFFTQEAMDAEFAARLAGLPVLPIRAWVAQDSTVAAVFPSGARLIHHPGAPVPFTALTPCRGGIHHPHPVATRTDLDEACRNAGECDGLHGRDQLPTPPEPTPDPAPESDPDATPTVAVLTLTEVTAAAAARRPGSVAAVAVARRRLAHDRIASTTQALSLADIAAGLDQRADDQAKEHPSDA